jgi:hypothetical protein
MPKKKNNKEAEAQADAVTTTTETTSTTEAEPAPAPEPAAEKKAKKGKRGLTLVDLSERYLTHLAEGEWSGGTIASYSMELKTAQNEMGPETLISEITPERVQTYFDSKRVTKLRSGKAKAKPSVDKTRRVLRLALVWAEESGLVEKAPLPEQSVNA